MSNFEWSMVDTNGIRLRYYRSGGAKPPVVLVHGITDSGLCWTPVARRLAAQFDVIMYDARGHGRSEVPAHGYGIADYARDLIGLAQSLELRQPMAIGHSLGAATVAAAAQTPGLFRRIVLEDPPWREVDQGPVDPSAEWIIQWRAQVIENKQKSTEELLAVGRARSPRWSDDELIPWAEAKQQVDPVVFDGASTIGHGWRTYIPHVHCPILLVTGDPEAGAIVAPPIADELRRLNPLLEVVKLPDAGHSIRRDDFDAYMEHVESFLARASHDEYAD